MGRKRVSDRIFGGVGLVLAVIYIWQATLVKLSFISDPVGPRTFPIIIGVMLGIASLVILLRPDPDPKWPGQARLLEIAAAAIILIGYAQLLPDLGFLLATVIAAAFLSWRLGATPLRSLLAGVAISGGIYVVFHLILGLSLARGPFGI